MEHGIKVIKKTNKSEDVLYTHTKSGIEQVFSNSDFHIGKYFMPKDTFLYADATDTSDRLKSYTVLEGSIKDLRTREVLTQGDVIIINSEGFMHSFYNVEDTILLLHEQAPKSIVSFKATASDMTEMLAEIQSKDNYTKEHSERVFQLAKHMGMALGYHSKQIYNLNKASRFHDIGKIYIADEILNKPAMLTPEEYELMKGHTQHCKDIIEAKFDPEIFEIINQHHERLDGSGYPLGLTEDQICEEAKILAICDSFDAMTTDRVYKTGKSREQAFEELKQLSGTHYDARLVELFLELNQ